MPRKAVGLTAAKVRTAPPGRYGDGGGLYLLVRSPEARYWLFRYTTGGRMREMGLGPASGTSAVSLAEARGKAAELLRQTRAGIDPLAKREADSAAAAASALRTKTFREVAALYIAAHEAGWRNAKHRWQWGTTLAAHAYPQMGDLPVSEVSTPHVMAVLEPIWREKTETAARLRGRIESVLDYAAARGWGEGENPARWRGHLSNLLPARSRIARVVHYPALPWPQVGDFLARLRGRTGISARALEFAVLAAARSGEVLGMRWHEVDLASKLWIVPRERMKAGREHRVPLSPPALAVLWAMLPPDGTEPPGDALVFEGPRSGKPLTDIAFPKLLRRMRCCNITAHGFRSSFRDWVAEATNYPRELAEAALAHSLRDKAEAAYQRGDMLAKRRRMMEDWALFCAQPSAIEAEREGMEDHRLRRTGGA